MVTLAVPSLLNSADILMAFPASAALSSSTPPTRAPVTSHFPRIRLLGLEPQADANRARQTTSTILNLAFILFSNKLGVSFRRSTGQRRDFSCCDDHQAACVCNFRGLYLAMSRVEARWRRCWRFNLEWISLVKQTHLWRDSRPFISLT